MPVQRCETGSPDGPQPSRDAQPPSLAVPPLWPRAFRDAAGAFSGRTSTLEQEAPRRSVTQCVAGDADPGEDPLAGVTAYTETFVIDDAQPPRKRQRATSGVTVPQLQRHFATLSTEVRSMYEDLNDWQRTTPLLTRRKRCRPGRFDSYRLRALERFALEFGGAGLPLEWQERLYDLLDTWDGTKPGMPHEDGHNQTLREAFPSANSFKDAIRDDVDDAVLEEGWCKCTMDVDGLSVTTFLCPALDLLLEALHNAKEVQFWSGEDGPAPLTSIRETPFDGDAFRNNEDDVVRRHGPDSFVLGVHLFSDSSHISESGGKHDFIWGVCWRA